MSSGGMSRVNWAPTGSRQTELPLTDLEAAWGDLHDAKPPGWFVGQPMYHDNRREWDVYAFDTRERAKAGHRSREWTVVAQSELECVREMARCLGLIRDGLTPT
jgi:hypothetical protein